MLNVFKFIWKILLWKKIHLNYVVVYNRCRCLVINQFTEPERPTIDTHCEGQLEFAIHGTRMSAL